MRRNDPGMAGIVDNIRRSVSKEGIPESPILIPKAFGGSGTVQRAWVLCDAPVILHTLIRMGLEEDPTVRKAIAALSELVRENGWPCAAAPALGKFRGPGSKEDPCPLANLWMLELLAADAAFRKSPAARKGVEGALALWASRKTHKAYLFGMGTDSQKMNDRAACRAVSQSATPKNMRSKRRFLPLIPMEKAGQAAGYSSSRESGIKTPLIWYDLLHMTDALSKYPEVRKEKRFRQMIRLLSAKADREGRFTPESVWRTWKDWEFGQKKQPSRWITFLAQRILRRAEA